MNKTLALVLAFIIPVGLALAASNPAFVLTDPSDGHSTGTIDGTTNELNMVGGFKENGSDTLSNSVSGNSGTATALAADPTDCTGVNFARGVNASGTASCAQPSDVTGNAATATALAADGANCPANQFNKGVDASGAVQSCAALVDADVPDTITVDLAATATALAANGTNCSAGNYPLGVDASGNVESCTAEPVNTNAQTICGTGEYLDGDGGCNVLSVAGAGWEVIAYASGTSVTALPLDAVLESSKTYRINGWVRNTPGQATTYATYSSSMTFNGDNSANYTWWKQGYLTTTGIGSGIGNGTTNSTSNGFALCAENNNADAKRDDCYCSFRYTFRSAPGHDNVIWWGDSFGNDPRAIRWLGPTIVAGVLETSSGLTSVEFGGRGAMLIDAEITLEELKQTVYFP